MKTSFISISNPINKKIDWAQLHFDKYGDELLQDTSTAHLIKKLEEAIQDSRDAMANAGIVALCTQCEMNEGGSCCGPGLENKYDAELILINLMMGVKLPREKDDPTSCFFLGRKGCILKARHVICVNYICRKVSEEINPAMLNSLREKEGVELNTLFLLHERIKKSIR
jgi:hypothetical protein